MQAIDANKKAFNRRKANTVKCYSFVRFVYKIFSLFEENNSFRSLKSPDLSIARLQQNLFWNP